MYSSRGSAVGWVREAEISRGIGFVRPGESDMHARRQRQDRSPRRCGGRLGSSARALDRADTPGTCTSRAAVGMVD
jgi:hypothetical protein